MALNICCRWRIARHQSGSSSSMLCRRHPYFPGDLSLRTTTTHRTITSLVQPGSTPHSVRRRYPIGNFSFTDMTLSRAVQPRRPRLFLSSPSDRPLFQPTRRQLSVASSSTTTDDHTETATDDGEDLNSSMTDMDNDDDDKEEETDRQRAAKKLRRKRIAKGRKQLREFQKAVAQSGQETNSDSSTTTESVPLRSNIETLSSEKCATFYDDTVLGFDVVEVEGVLKDLAKMTSTKQTPRTKKGSRRKVNAKPDVVASLPTITILTGMLRETTKAAKDSSKNLLQTRVLEFLLSGGTTTSRGDDDSADSSSSSAKSQKELERSSGASIDELRAKFVDALLDLQKLVLAEKAESEEEDKNDGSAKEGVDDNIDDMFSKAKKPKKEKRKRSQRRYNFVFEALPLFVNTTKLPKERENPAPSTIADLHATDAADRVVFVDNLPIDITVEELDRLYSRFGELASVRIFNQRLDLDPGPLNKTEKAARLKKQLRSSNFDNSRWNRPCSPVYAQMIYADAKGCREALDDALRIFGMIIHRHPARSIRSSDMTRLYLENVPAGHTCVDVEYELSRLLDPDLYICLGEGQNNRAEVGSCEIRFSSFEWALHAFEKLETLNVVRDEGNDCRVNWLKTPDGASKWWTRKIGFN